VAGRPVKPEPRTPLAGGSGVWPTDSAGTAIEAIMPRDTAIEAKKNRTTASGLKEAAFM
jgi:hypothetical protein